MHVPDIEMASEAWREAAECAAGMRLPLKQMVWRGSAGEFSGAGAGSSMDFQDHRSYLPGDDPRHINWAAYSRTGNYTLKVFREEVSPTVEILMDCSNSMFLNRDKAYLSSALLAYMLASAKKDGASTIIHLLGNDHEVITEEEVLQGSWVSRISTSNRTRNQQPSAPALEEIPLRAGGLRILISDLLFASQPSGIMQALLRNRGSALIFAPYTQAEAQPDWYGVCEFHDIETGHIESRDANSDLVKRYRAAYRAHFNAWKEEASRHHLTMARVPAGQTLTQALSAEAISSRALVPYS